MATTSTATSPVRRAPGTLLPTYVFETGDDLARDVARIVAGVIRERNALGQNAVLGLPSGSTPVGVYRELVRRALAEDFGWGDVTTAAVIDPKARGRAVLLAKSPCVLAGLDVAAEAFRQLDPGVTITIAHHALRANHRRQLIFWLAATFILGFVFLGMQVKEYLHLYLDENVRLDTGIYGNTFFFLTGFHGLHVTLGAIMLVVIWLRVLRGHFTPQRHFAFEGVAWYWHFVDVVWLGLFFFVYWV